MTKNKNLTFSSDNMWSSPDDKPPAGKKKLSLTAKKPSRGDPKVIENLDAFHIGLASVLGDGHLPKKGRYCEIEQRSPTYATWKLQICQNVGLKSFQPSPSQRQEKIWKLAKGVEAQLCNLTWKTRNKPLNPKKEQQIQGDEEPQEKPTPKKVKGHGFAFCTRALLGDTWRDLFYEKIVADPKPGEKAYRKRLPLNIKELLWGNLALAIWFLDDGWYDWQKKTARISASEYSASECDLMVECLKENFNLDATIYTSRGVPHHFYIFPRSYAEFYKRVKPYVNDLATKYPQYAVNSAMKNKVLPP